MGHSLFQKIFVADHLTKRVVRNKGQLPKYYAEETHPAIIDEATFHKAQEIRVSRSAKYKAKDSSLNRYPYTGKIVCGICGKNYKRKKGVGRWYWQCTTYFQEGKVMCQSTQIPEKVLDKLASELGGIEQVANINVTGAHRLSFVLKDGQVVEREWQNPSRRESWTPEMKELARQKMIEIHRERKKRQNEQS